MANAKELHFDVEARSSLKSGVDQLVDAVKVTLYGSRKAEPDEEAQGEPGSILAVEAAGLTIRCGRGAVRVDTAMVEGGKRVPAAEWAAAAGVTPGTLLT